jgi:hypothetical protein
MYVLSHAVRTSSRFVVMMLTTAVVIAAAAQAPAPVHSKSIRGVVTEIHGNSLTIKSDADGAVSTVAVPNSAKLLRIAPGQKDISTAQPIQFSTLQSGDRVLVRLATGEEGSPLVADRVIAIKQEDLAEKQRADLADWQQRGITGLVRSVDAVTGNVVVATGGSQSSKTLTIHTSKTTVIRRYSPDSTQFADTHAATLADIHKGDQLRARGNKNEDGTELAAEDMVGGTFRTFAATVISIDATGSTLIITDLSTKKPVQVRVNADSNLRKLPDMMAQRMAMRMSTAAQTSASKKSTPPQSTSAPGAGMNAGMGHDMGRDMGRGGESPNPESFINRAPEFKLAELKKGDALLLLTTEGTINGPVTAITLLAGVEPLLRAGSGATQNMLLSSWNMNNGSGVDTQ